MTDDDETPETFERWYGPVRAVISAGGRRIPLAPPLPGETEPFAWVAEPSEVLSMDLDGRPVEGVLLKHEDGRGVMVITFKDGDSVTQDLGPVHTDHL